MIATEAPWDVVVIGAGPAGTSAATVLAEHGRRVLVVERNVFPRYRVGESLIPYCWFPLERLGMIERLDAAGCTVKKYSVQFVGTDGGKTTPFYFFDHTEHDCARSWQVVRSAFDQMLLDNARSHGAEVLLGATVRGLVERDGVVNGVRIDDADGGQREVSARMVIDASGRDMFAGQQKQWRVADPRLKKIAVWTYYRGALRDSGVDEGATTVAYLPEKGWFWYIPLPDDTVSVGVVAERDYLYRGERNPDAIFDREVAIQPWIESHLAAGERIGSCRVTGDYSYRSRYCAADGLVLTGDAFSFLDPVFSSGVFLALHGGVLAGDAVHEALETNDVSASRFATYGDRLCAGIEAMRRLVYAFYDDAFSFGEFLKSNPDMRGDLTDCLIGNVEKDLEPLFAAIKEYADVPDPLPHGRPLVNA